MWSFRPWRLSPNSRSKTWAVRATSSGMTLISRRVAGFMVVSHIMSGSFSPRPLERLMEHFLPASSPFTMSFFSASE